MRLASLFFTVVVLALPVPAAADPPGRLPPAEVLNFCRDVIAEEPGLPFGDCVSFLLSSDTGFATQYCRYLDDIGVLDEIGVSLSQCVAYGHNPNS